MPLNFEQSSAFESAIGQSSYSPDYNLQVGAGNYRLVVVTVGFEDDSNESVSNVTLDGKAPEGSLDIPVGSNPYAYSWMGWWREADLPGTTGLKTIVVTCSGAVQREIAVYVAEYTGASQSAEVKTNTDTIGGTGNVSCVVDVDSDDSLAVGVAHNGGAGIGSPTNLTSLHTTSHESSYSGFGHNLDVDPANTTIGWEGQQNRGTFIGAVFAPVGTEEYSGPFPVFKK